MLKKADMSKYSNKLVEKILNLFKKQLNMLLIDVVKFATSLYDLSKKGAEINNQITRLQINRLPKKIVM